jgi:hypothetical protein
MSETPQLSAIIEMMVASGNKALGDLNEYCTDAGRINHDLLMRLVRDNANTEYGKKYDFANIHSIEDYKAKVPFSTYDDYAAAIKKMVRGEKNLITVYPIVHYAMTSGSVDNPKNIPVSQETLDIYEKYTTDLMVAVTANYIEKTNSRKMHIGKWFQIMNLKEAYVADGTTLGPISAAIFFKVKDLLPLLASSPTQAFFPKADINLRYLHIRYALQEVSLFAIIAPFMTALVDMMHYMENNWEMFVHDIEAGTINQTIEMPKDIRQELETGFHPDPNRANDLRRDFIAGVDTPLIPRIWPDLDWIGAIGAGGFMVYTEKMRRYSGTIPQYFRAYGASEALMAVATEMESMEYTLLPQSGFYEFIPMDSDDETKTYNLDELEIGREYEIILTNLSGLYRYRIGDVVRVVSYQDQSPKLCFVYRKKQMVSIAGEKTNESCVAWVVEEFEKETGTTISDYSVYADTDSSPGRYVLFMEPSEHLPKDNYEKYRNIIEQKFSLANPSLGTKMKDGTLGPVDFHFVQQETYYLYREMMILRGISENQLKPVRVIDTLMKESFFFALIDND